MVYYFYYTLFLLLHGCCILSFIAYEVVALNFFGAAMKTMVLYDLSVLYFIFCIFEFFINSFY